MNNIEKIIIGALGGFSAVLVKFLGQDYANVVSHAANFTPEQLLNYQIGYGILTPILMFLGAFVAWISEEEKRIKIVALAIAAPAMVTTWSGGSKVDIPDPNASMDFFISSAYAGEMSLETGYIKSVEIDKNTEKGTLEKITGGVGVFFGYDKLPKKYWVIVGSFKSRGAAQQYADDINEENSAINANVGFKVPPNEYYPVIVGNYSLLSEAKILKEKALETKTIKDAYLSSGAKR